ncbi:hypothetical protein BJV74DRAFT_858008 [Russula compacta]|nr:hypothetical protein BJV74DRAFT_858008 [Russula compacta]
MQFPSLHEFRISPPQPQHDGNPPPGLFRWHYLQCVIKKFAHADYRNLQNIAYHELPFRMEGDSDLDSDGTNGANNRHDWPSADLDRGRAMQVVTEQDEERQRFVAEWLTAV